MGLMPLFPHEQPSSKDDLQAWALERANAHLPPALERMRLLWEKDERKAGEWSEVDPAKCLAMVHHALLSTSMRLNAAWRQMVGPDWRHGAVASVQRGQHLMAFPTKPLTAIPCLLRSSFVV